MLTEADAIDLVAAFKAACDLAHASIAPVTASLAPDDANAYKRMVGAFMGNAYLCLMRPLAEKFATARVPDYDATAIPAPAGIAAAFLARAGAAITRYRPLIAQCEADGTLRAGAMHDIEQAHDALAAYFSGAADH
jgi:hypothetical protein